MTMTINLTPQLRPDQITVCTVYGDTLTINDDELDFSGIENGGTLERDDIDCIYMAGDVTRDLSGDLTVTILLPFGSGAPEETRFPEPIVVEQDGPVTLPPYGAPDE